MLANCKSKWGLKGYIIIEWDENGKQLPKEMRSAKMGSACVDKRST